MSIAESLNAFARSWRPQQMMPLMQMLASQRQRAGEMERSRAEAAQGLESRRAGLKAYLDTLTPEERAGWLRQNMAELLKAGLLDPSMFPQKVAAKQPGWSFGNIAKKFGGAADALTGGRVTSSGIGPGLSLFGKALGAAGQPGAPSLDQLLEMSKLYRGATGPGTVAGTVLGMTPFWKQPQQPGAGSLGKTLGLSNPFSPYDPSSDVGGPPSTPALTKADILRAWLAMRRRKYPDAVAESALTSPSQEY